MAAPGRFWRERILESQVPVRRPAISRRRLERPPEAFRAAEMHHGVACVSDAGRPFGGSGLVTVTRVSMARPTAVSSAPTAFTMETPGVEAVGMVGAPPVSRPDWNPAASVRAAQGWDAVRTFDQPTALRRLLHSAGELGTLADPGCERRLVDLLRAADRREINARQELAERAVLRSLGGANLAPRIELVKVLAGQAGGQGITRGRWGEDVVLDRLRLRTLAHPRRTKRTEDVGWVGFLDWAGRGLGSLELEELPGPLLRSAAAALAVSQGYAGALARVTALGRVEDRSDDEFGVRSLLSLRAVVEGSVSTRHVDELVPPPVLAQGRKARSPWVPALVAWHLLRERSASAAFVRLTAALVSSEFRARLRGLARRAQIAPPGGWGTPTGLEASASVIRLLGAAGWDEIGRSAPLVPREWGGPVARAWEEALHELLRDRQAARLCFLEDRLSAAAGFLLFGMAPSCVAVLRAARVAPDFEPARAALERAAGAVSRSGASSALLASFNPPDRDSRNLVGHVREFPDPSVALHSPFWLLGEGRSEVQSRFLKAGNFNGFRVVRELLDHPQHPRRLRPFWLLRSKADTRGVVDLALWLGKRTPEPLEPRWIGFIERQARKVWPEWNTRS